MIPWAMLMLVPLVLSDQARLNQLLGDGWSQEMCVDLSVHGLPDPGRLESAEHVIEEALLITRDMQERWQTNVAAGQRLPIDSATWRVSRGIACAAKALLDSDHSELAEEARILLEPLHVREQSGRATRLLAALALSKGEIKKASELLVNLKSREGVASTEKMACLAMEVQMDPDLGAASILQCDTHWQVVLVGESWLAAGLPSQVNEQVVAIRTAFERAGATKTDALELSAEMVSRLGVSQLEVGHFDDAFRWGRALAAMKSGQPDLAAAWLQGRGREGACGARLAAAAAEVAEVQGNARVATMAWREAAESDSQYWDAAARYGRSAAEQGDQAAYDTLVQASRSGKHRGHWSRILASIDWHAGKRSVAMRRLTTIAAHDPVQLAALDQLADMIHGGDPVDEEEWGMLKQASAAAMAAAMQEVDVARSMEARPVAARLHAAEVNHLMAHGQIEAALAISDRMPKTWLPLDQAHLLEAQLAAMSGDQARLRALIRSEAVRVSELLAWAGGREDPMSAPRYPSVIAEVMEVLPDPEPDGDARTRLAAAHAIRQAGHCESALRWYEDLLAASPDLLPAVLGRSECLRHASDRSILALAAQGYRRVAALPRESDPMRWRLAHQRLLGVLADAGVDPDRLEAQRARLRVVDPEFDQPAAD